MSDRCSDCDHRWAEHTADEEDNAGCQHRYLNGDRCSCDELLFSKPVA